MISPQLHPMTNINGFIFPFIRPVATKLDKKEVQYALVLTRR